MESAVSNPPRLRDHSDLLLHGSRAVHGRLPAARSTGAATVTVPASTPSAKYFVLACADDRSVVVEANELNNCLASLKTVRVD